MSVQLREILELADEARFGRDSSIPWERVESHAIHLSLFLRRAVQQAHDFNEGNMPPGQNLCKLCAGHTWGRPHRDDAKPGEDQRDYTRRECNDCGEIRPEPEEE